MTLQAPPKPPASQAAFFDDPSIYYADGDGEPMAESPAHLFCMSYGFFALKSFYASDPNVWVTGNNFIYYEPNNPRVRVSPDLYVVVGVPKNAPRTSFVTWREGGKMPSIVFEFTSKKTKDEDITRKRELYEQVLRVPEYILFDPTGDFLTPPLQGLRLVNGKYVPIVPISPGRLFSQILGLEIVAQGDEFRFYDPVRQRYLDEYQDVDLRADREAARADEEAARADTEAAKAKQEALRRAEAEAENAHLRALLAQLTQKTESGEDAA